MNYQNKIHQYLQIQQLEIAIVKTRKTIALKTNANHKAQHECILKIYIRDLIKLKKQSKKNRKN